MSQEVVIFSFQSMNIRTLTIEGETFFRASDVASALSMRGPDLVRNIDEEEDVRKVHTLTEGGQQEISYFSESGLYTVLLRSNKAEAKPFRRWVTREVLPSIRKQGFYMSEQLKEQLAEKDLELERKESVILKLQGKTKKERRWLVPSYENQLPGFPSEPRMVLKPQAEIKQPELNIAKYNHLKRTIEGIERQMAALKKEIGMV
jgi:prophage antirepressor-like protein